ncbi:hypothetical protein GCM10010361_46810 [Streptomyces olivaceiscleroticus]|uniref:Uncharacterized protein n=1 Tax=Streptomyces olivaceiscleroticus TaxID=68245 RepID=A0ABN1AHY0_9ACTN
MTGQPPWGLVTSDPHDQAPLGPAVSGRGADAAPTATSGDAAGIAGYGNTLHTAAGMEGAPSHSSSMSRATDRGAAWVAEIRVRMSMQ